MEEVPIDGDLWDIERFFDGPSGLPKFELTHVHHGVMNFVLHTDFSLTRPGMPVVSPNSEFVNGVASKDVKIHEDINLCARLFLPEIAQTSKKNAKLPLCMYVHGGGFICLSTDSRMIHDFCEELCRTTGAIVVSVDYRLAPEHRIPSQYQDARRALDWLRLQALKVDSGAVDVSPVDTSIKSNPENFDPIAAEPAEDTPDSEPWLISHADFERLFFVGDSAGGNIVHNLFIESSTEDISPLKLLGMILIQPAFGGVVRTPAEINSACEVHYSAHFFWKLALPQKSDRSHPGCHVLPKLIEHLQHRKFLDVLLVVGGRDPLRDWQFSYYETLRDFGAKVKLVKYDDAVHAFYVGTDHRELANQLFTEILQFVRDH